jgi:hypothetical protein
VTGVRNAVDGDEVELDEEAANLALELVQ